VVPYSTQQSVAGTTDSRQISGSRQDFEIPDYQQTDDPTGSRQTGAGPVGSQQTAVGSRLTAAGPSSSRQTAAGPDDSRQTAAVVSGSREAFDMPDYQQIVASPTGSRPTAAGLSSQAGTVTGQTGSRQTTIGMPGSQQTAAGSRLTAAGPSSFRQTASGISSFQQNAFDSRQTVGPNDSRQTAAGIPGSQQASRRSMTDSKKMLSGTQSNQMEGGNSVANKPNETIASKSIFNPFSSQKSLSDGGDPLESSLFKKYFDGQLPQSYRNMGNDNNSSNVQSKGPRANSTANTLTKGRISLV